MKCSKCGAELGNDVLFCRDCGAKVVRQQKRFCYECGAEYIEGVKFCTYCGTRLATPDNSVNTETEPERVLTLDKNEADEIVVISKNNITAPQEEENASEEVTEDAVFDTEEDVSDADPSDMSAQTDKKEGVLAKKVKAVWSGMSVFSKITIVSSFVIGILAIIAFCVGKGGPITISILQIAGVVVAILMHNGVIKTKKTSIKYIVLVAAILLSIVNVLCYPHKTTSKETRQNTVVDSSAKKASEKSAEVTTALTPYSSSGCIGKDVDTVQLDFMTAGFYYVKTEAIADLEFSELNQEGTVQSVTINGVREYSGNQEFTKNANVVIFYHSCKKIPVPISSDDVKLSSTEELTELFTNAGFPNVLINEAEDLDPDSTDEPFELGVTINGSHTFNKNDHFPANSTVLITTHKPYEKCHLKITVDFIPNLILNTYDVEVEVDGHENTLKHGEDGEFEYGLKAGTYTIKFTSADSYSVKGSVDIEVTGETEASYKIYCHSDDIEIDTLFVKRMDTVGENEAMAPNASSYYEYKDYEEVSKAFADAGFTNISTSILYDIVWGITSEGEVESVTVNGLSDFSGGDVFAKDVPVVITYHMKEEDDPNKPKEAETDVEKTTSNNQPASSTQEPTVLTAENNEDLAALINAEAVGTDKQAAFTKKYKGKTIEFDAIIYDIFPTEKYDSINDYVLVPGEDADNIGATFFIMEDVQDIVGFHWDKETRPSYVTIKSKIRVRAEVITGDDPMFIYLKPVKTWGR